MSLEGTIAAVIMLIIGAAWLVLPILRRRYAASTAELARQKERDALLTTYERTLASLRDVDEDHLTGKLAQEDYEAERAYWTEQGVAVLEALEKAGGKAPQPKAPRSPKAAKRQRNVAPQPAYEVSDSDANADPDAVLDDAIEQTIANYVKSMH